MIPTLTHNTPIRAASWYDCMYAHTWTLLGDCAERGRDYDTALARAEARGHDLVGSIYVGATLLGDRAAAARRLAHDRQIAAGAVTLATGDHVDIDGVRYVVKFAGSRSNEFGRAPAYSDPIHFIRA